jgi:hypothetical protein
MRDYSANRLKAWAKDYEEAPFFFVQESEYGKRLVAWTEEAEQAKRAFYGILELLPQCVDVLLKSSTGKEADGKPKWARFHGVIDRWLLSRTVQENEIYVFSDGMHQLCVKDPESDHYLAFDDHGIFFVYAPTETDAELFRSLGFEPRCAEPIYSKPHFQVTPPNSEILEAKFVGELKLEKANSDIE